MPRCFRRLSTASLPGFLGLLLLGPMEPARASTLDAIRELEALINATGTETLLRSDCPPSHAGFYENDGRGVDRLVICRNSVDLADVEAVWEVMAHEATHVMQACAGTHVIPDAAMPRTYRELRTIAPHYAKLVDQSYGSTDQRLEAEAFWMELQVPATVIALFRHACRRFLEAGR
jgi:hypothetical protein